MRLRTPTAITVAASLAIGFGDCANAQTTLNNPLIRPNTMSREPTMPAPPPGTPPASGSNARQDGPVQAKSLQEEVTANQQKLNAERVPAPLRMLLATVYVSAIHNKSAVLRQPLPPSQQAMLAAQAQGSVGGTPGAVPGAIPGALPGAMLGAIPGALPGAAPGAGLSTGVGLVNPFAVPPPRPTSFRVRDGESFSLQGFELIAKIREQEVTLLWKNGEERNTIVFQSGIESPSLPAFVPPAANLEKPEGAYFGRVQAGGGSSPGSGSASSGASGGGASGGAR